MKTIVIIDNGHGIETKGKCSPNNVLKEYEWTRVIALMLRDRLKEEGIESYILVPEKEDIKLTERVARVKRVCAEFDNAFLVSIHINADGIGQWSEANGFSVFVSKKAGSKSKVLASIFTDLAKEQDLTGNRSIPKDKYWTWSWTDKDIYILTETPCPAVLTENMFMTNKGDFDFLMSEAGKKKIVDLHIDAIKKYLS